VKRHEKRDVRTRKRVLSLLAAAACVLCVADSVAAQPAPDVAAALQTTATVPARCTITTSFREIEADGQDTGTAVLGAIVAACTRGSSQSLTLRLPGGAADCDRLAIEHLSATVCGGLAAAAFVRTLAQLPASEIKAYVSIFTNTTRGPQDDAAAIAIQF
jgi:hypothetical protein